MNYDCTGSTWKAWNGVGESSDHSSDVVGCASSQNPGVDSKKPGTAHGLPSASSPYISPSSVSYTHL